MTEALTKRGLNIAVEFDRDGEVHIGSGRSKPDGFLFERFNEDYRDLIGHFLDSTSYRKAALSMDESGVKFLCWGSVVVECRRKIEETCWK